MKTVTQVIPKEQKAIIGKALDMLDKALSDFSHECDAIQWQRHDIISLKAFLDYDLSVTMSKERKDKFTFLHKVDFPEYVGVDAQYPIENEPKDEWVTLMVGDFSAVDDNVHEREIHINNLVSMERHLRSQVDEVIENLDDGHEWFVVEDYDGAIITDTKKVDKRNFQVVWLESHYPDANTMVEDREFFNDNGFTDEDINRIEALDVSDQCITEEGGVIIIRLSDSE